MCTILDFELALKSGESDSSLADLLQMRDYQAEIYNKSDHLRRIHEEMHWFIISEGDENRLVNLYQPEINEIKRDITRLQKELATLQETLAIEQGI